MRFDTLVYLCHPRPKEQTQTYLKTYQTNLFISKINVTISNPCLKKEKSLYEEKKNWNIKDHDPSEKYDDNKR